MAEQTFRSPGFFENEIDLSGRSSQISGIPAGVIGTAQRGPAFVPVTVGSFSDFIQKFGSLDSKKFGPYAAHAFLQHKSALTYVRVLGAGSNLTTNDIIATQTKGTVKNAGFFLSGSKATAAPSLLSAAGAKGRHNGTVQFIAGLHQIQTEESRGFPSFTRNDSTVEAIASFNASLIRGMLFTSTGSRIELLDFDANYSNPATAGDNAKIKNYDGSSLAGTFKLVVSSSGVSFSNDESKPGIKIYTASLDPTSQYYISKVLNTKPERFHIDKHLLYGNFEVESELAKVRYHAANTSVCLLSGSDSKYTISGGDTSTSFLELFGNFQTRYQTAKTTSFISQPFGEVEYDLFHFESLDDGAAGNTRVKISITNLKRPLAASGGYPTFSVLVRDYNDSDTDLRVLEQFPNLTLNPNDPNYIANKIGDLKVFYNFDAETKSERRLTIKGKRANRSQYIRVIMNANVEDKIIPQETLPFGFRGLPLLKTNNNLTDKAGSILPDGSNSTRLESIIAGSEISSLKNSILPPVPFTFKTTRGSVDGTGAVGSPSATELADSRYFWGIKFTKVPRVEDISAGALNSNASAEVNPLLQSYSKLLGIAKLDTITTGSGQDSFHNNKFSLAKVALNKISNSGHTLIQSITQEITSSAKDHIREAAYIRNAVTLFPMYSVRDPLASAERLTFGSLIASTGSASKFNQFSDYLKFTNMFYGGFDGVNILDPDQAQLNDKSSSTENGGHAGGGVAGYKNLSNNSSPGVGIENNIINSYREASKIITDPMNSRINILAIPGIREPFVADHAADLTRDYSRAIYIMDIPSYDDTGKRRYSDSTSITNIRQTVSKLDGRAVNNSFAATYFPDVVKKDPIDNFHVKLPASAAALKALSFNDSISFPWFAPAGFNRGALDDVENTDIRLNTEDRNVLYESRINPIASFPQGGFVIFGQKTLQQDRSALDRVNVRRMLLEVKRIISDLGNKFLFEQNTPALRAKFVAQATPKLAIIQAQQGIDQFKVVMDSSNNSQDDIINNKLNGKIVLVPTRVAEFIVVDFVITNSGVSFA